VPDGIRASTWEGYEAHVRLHINPFLGGIVASELTKKDVGDWLKWLAKEKRSRAMRRKVLVTLRAALDWAIGERVLRDNPAKAVALPKAEPRAKWKPYDVETTQAMIRAVHGHRLEALFLVALTVGARLGELLALKWDEDIDESERTISINHTLDRVAGEVVRYPAKTDASNRTIRLPDSVWDKLVEHRERQEAERTSARWTEWGFVFTTKSGRPLRGDGAGGAAAQFKTRLLRAGLTPGRFHDLRHQAASTLLMLNGGNAFEVQQIMGHSSHRMTLDLYGHLMPERLDHIVGQLDRYYAGFLEAPVALKDSDATARGVSQPRSARPGGEVSTEVTEDDDVV
jgi:integrase